MRCKKSLSQMKEFDAMQLADAHRWVEHGAAFSRFVACERYTIFIFPYSSFIDHNFEIISNLRILIRRLWKILLDLSSNFSSLSKTIA